MDRLESLSSTIQNITLYDIKSMYNQAKNVVLNISEMEAKVREATNDDPWGASSSLMQEIAQGTFHFQHFNEIMPSIYSRFMEKEARQWRQIYKALQLLEYLIKHGSERVVDDARSHISTLKMLRNFHYIDDKGKDEGLNVRNRSRELVELLSDVEKIRAERRKAKANKSKYVGVGNDGFGGGMSFDSGGGRYGGFGGDSLGGGGSFSGNYSNDHVSGGSSSRGAGSSSFSDTRRGYEEYNAGDDEVTQSSPTRVNSGRSPVKKSSIPTSKPVPAPEPVVDLLGGFDDDTFGAPASAPSVSLPTNKALPSVGLDDDDFADFQAAPVQAMPVSAAIPQPATGAKKPNLMDMLNTTSVQTPANIGYGQPQQQPVGYGMGVGGNVGMGGGGMGMMGMNIGGHRQTPSLSSNPSQYSSPIQIQPQLQPQQPNLFGGSSVPMRPMTIGGSQTPMSNSSAKPPAAATQAKSANFDDLWSMSLGGGGGAKPGATTASKSIKDLEKEKATAGIWGGQQKPVVGGPAPTAFGVFGNAAPPSSSGGDDLLL
ncbi:ENTH-domain-containing protein [Phlegmacium glaucopus]|nr:ENTH-domain-containing protein [Phlegmacium glaucopus]